jgi:hypothetical protein
LIKKWRKQIACGEKQSTDEKYYSGMEDRERALASGWVQKPFLSQSRNNGVEGPIIGGWWVHSCPAATVCFLQQKLNSQKHIGSAHDLKGDSARGAATLSDQVNAVPDGKEKPLGSIIGFHHLVEFCHSSAVIVFRIDFLYYDDDSKGLKCPPGSHMRRMNPRDSFKHEAVQVNRHRVLRRGMAYGPLLPEGVLEDDGVDRGIIFIFVGADLKRQFEFVQSEWVNQGIFIGTPGEKDPLNGSNDGTGMLTIPKQPIRQRLQGLPQFVTNCGGEYFFLPGLRALQWLADAT